MTCHSRRTQRETLTVVLISLPEIFKLVTEFFVTELLQIFTEWNLCGVYKTKRL